MSKSDFFVVITIVLAIVALFSETNRKYILYKFSFFKIFLLLAGFLIVHILVWSNEWMWWKDKWIDVCYLEKNCPLFKSVINYFNVSIDNFPTPSTYAYILFIVILFLVCLNIGKGSFSKKYLNALMDEYKIMVDENEMEKLYNLLKKYHSDDIHDYLEAKNSLIKERNEKNKAVKQEEEEKCKCSIQNISNKLKKNKKKEKELKQELETEKINLLCLKRDLGKVRKRWKKILTLKRHERIKILWTKTKCVDFFHYYYEQLRLVKLKSCSLYQQCRWLKKFNSLKRLMEKKDDEIKYCIQQQKKQKHNKRDCEQQLIVLKDKDLLYPNVQNDYISNLTAMEKKPRMKFAKAVFEEVLKNESFMKKTLRQTSNFYLSFIPLMNNSEYEEFVQKIIEFLIREENISFVREIRNASKLCFFWGSQITKEEYPILYVLSNDCGVYILNSLWRPIGETTIEYIQKEIENDAMHLLYKVPDNKDSLFSTSVIFVAINFFNIMTSCVILQKRVDNVWILYYYHFVKELLNGLDEKDLNKNADSQVIFFIQEMCRYLNELLALAKKMGVKEHVFFINHCKSQILELIKDCLKIDESCRKELIEELT